MAKYKHPTRLLVVAMMMTLGFWAPGAMATAVAANQQPSSNTTTPTVAQSYATDKPLQQGLIVQLDSKNSSKVSVATYKNSKKMFGVVVAPTSVPASLSTESAAGQAAYVMTSGRYSVLVSNQNGAISAGDWVSISAANGIGMKADTTENYVLGRAVNGFDGKNNVISTSTLKKSDGKQLKVAFGAITVDIQIQPNPQQTGNGEGVPAVVQGFAEAIIGKPISAGRLYLSVLIALIGLVVAGMLMYGGIQSSMISIGRNPLARPSIMRSLLQVIMSSLMIFVGCLIAVYLILKI